MMFLRKVLILAGSISMVSSKTRISKFEKMISDMNPQEVQDTSLMSECVAACAASETCGATNVLFSERKCTSIAWGMINENESSFNGVTYKKIYPPPECMNGGLWSDTTKTSCNCPGSYAGQYCQRFWHDCHEGFNKGIRQSGLYTIQPRSDGTPFQVQCYMVRLARTVVQIQRDTQSIDFNRNWQEYKDGFGSVNGSYWLGLEKIKEITDRARNLLVISLRNVNTMQPWSRINCHNVLLTNEFDGFRLNFTHTSSPTSNFLQDIMTELRGAKFSTFDRDNDENTTGSCSEKYHSGWWFKNCTSGNPNGKMEPSDPQAVFWQGHSGTVSQTRMFLESEFP